ncbi:hypothetical protein [Streptomyces sp. NPDC004284]|uniref:hypothetical protein n=1 Tax=Streptomyces sp. NPDC004284 TaxID=3364695 RepID=UPI0036B80AFC
MRSRPRLLRDSFGPRGGARSDLGDLVLPALPAGRTATVLGGPDQPHTGTFLPGIGEALALPGRRPDAPGRTWHLPQQPAHPRTRTTRELVDPAHCATGRPGTARHRPAPPGCAGCRRSPGTRRAR